MELVRVIKMCLNEAYNKAHIYSFSVQRDLKQGEAYRH
jgi:hypothetical protein